MKIICWFIGHKWMPAIGMTEECRRCSITSREFYRKDYRTRAWKTFWPEFIGRFL